MDKTTLTIITVAGLVVVFVVSRYVGLDSGKVSSLKPQTQSEVSEFAHWHQFTPESKEFTASFPRTPEHLSETVKHFGKTPQKIDLYAAEGLDNTVYAVEKISSLKRDESIETSFILENTLADIVSSSEINSLVERKNTTFQNHQSITFEIDSGSKTIRGVMFYENESVYVLTQVNIVQDNDNVEGFKNFIDSFSLKTSPSEGNQKNR